MFLPLLVAFASLFSSGDVTPDVSRGAALMQGCEAELRLMARTPVTTSEQSDLINGSYCIGYVNGFLANNPKEAASTICPGEQPIASLIAAYVRYMQQNPRLLQEDKRVGLRLALESAFPCAGSGKIASLGAGSRRDRL